MLHLGLFALAQPGLLQVDLILEHEPALLLDRPDSAADGRQSGNHSGEKFPVVLLRGDLRFGELGDLVDQRANLLFGLLDQVRVASPCNASWDEMLGDDRLEAVLRSSRATSAAAATAASAVRLTIAMSATPLRPRAPPCGTCWPTTRRSAGASTSRTAGTWWTRRGRTSPRTSISARSANGSRAAAAVRLVTRAGRVRRVAPPAADQPRPAVPSPTGLISERRALRDATSVR